MIRGLKHAFAGIVTIVQDAPQAVQGIADGLDPAVLDVFYPAATGAVINQLGFNLLWIECVTTHCALFVWRRSATANFLAALAGGLAGVGYFFFMDLGGLIKFVPGTVMMMFSSAAIVTSFIVYFKHLKRN